MARSRGSLDEVLKGKLSIHKASSNVQPDYVTIEVEDESSSTRAIMIKCSLDTFAKALFGSGYLDVEYSMNRVTPGMQYEHEQRVIFVPVDEEGGSYSEERRKLHVRNVLRKHETDGWQARDSDAMNMHRVQGPSSRKGSSYNVTFYRWIRPDGSPLIDDDEPAAVAAE